MALFITAVAIQTPCNAADKVRIGYTSPTPNHGVLWVADTSSLFKKNNLDLEIVYMPGNISLPSLLSGEIQFAQMTGALMSPARLQIRCYLSRYQRFLLIQNIDCKIPSIG